MSKVCMGLPYTTLLLCGKPHAHVVHSNISYVTCKACLKAFKEYKSMISDLKKEPQILFNKDLLKPFFIKHNYTLNNTRI